MSHSGAADNVEDLAASGLQRILPNHQDKATNHNGLHAHTTGKAGDFYIPSLDGIRAIAFLLVFVAHAGLDKIVPGGFGVTVFFFLSGYLITSILRLEATRAHTVSLGKFYVRRAFRILPPMYVTLALAYILGFTGILRESGNWFGLLAASGYFFNYTDLLHLRAILPSGTGVLWSLMVEEHFYLVFPLAYRTFVRRGTPARKQVAILLGCCATALLWRYVLVYLIHTPLTTLPRWTYSASDARFDSILFGCILAIRDNAWFGDRSSLLRRFKGTFAITGIILILASLLYREPHFRETLRYTLQSIALYPIFYYCVSSSHQWQVRWLEWKPLRWLGWVSYTMYLFHFIPLGIGMDRYPSHLVLVAIASFAVSLAYSWFIRVSVEQPSRRWRQRFVGRIQSPAKEGVVSTKRIYVDQVRLDPVTMNEAIQRTTAMLLQERTRAAHVVTANVQFVGIAHREPRFANIIDHADLSVADGVPLVWASRLLGHPVPERVNGTDLMVRLCEAAASSSSTVYFMGGRSGAADCAAQRLCKIYPGLQVVGVDCPPFGFIEDPDLAAKVAHRIELARPDLLFVALGAPKQEYWIEQHTYLPAKVMIGVGGSFELVAGFTRRAPRALQKAGCEWLWRLCMEPRRLWKRYLVGNTLFLGLVLRQCLHRAKRRSPSLHESV